MDRTPVEHLHGSSQSVSTWLRASQLGLVVMALVVGVAAGFGAVGFRWLIFTFTWLATGFHEFGQQGRIASLHLPWLGIWFLLLIPIVGALLYGPLIERFAKEARGHGVPEVMLAVAENGGKIRPQVSGVKAFASAICIGTGGSVGREGPIVQIGSAFASTLGQVVRMSESRLRILVACGAAGGIAATFNAPLTGLFFGFEIILRAFSIEALFATVLSAVTADLISRAFFGSGPFFSSLPHNLAVHHVYTYLLVAVLGIAAGLVGWGFKTVLYKFEDTLDALWKGRPEWARPAVGGIALGAVLLLLPQMYGVGYPVMDRAVTGQYVLWFLIVLLLGKVIATSLTLSIGGSGGVFAPSLFMGAMAGMAFGDIVLHLFGHIVNSPSLFAITAMGGVFGAAAQAPLTAIASAVEMTGNFTLTLPVMLVVGIATALSKRLSYGSIYTTKLLRRGVDIERPRPTSVLQVLTVSDVMQPIFGGNGIRPFDPSRARGGLGAVENETWTALVGPPSDLGPPQALFSDETLEQALRQLVLYGQVGLPVLSADAHHLKGWVTRHDVMRALARTASLATHDVKQAKLAAEISQEDADSALHRPPMPLEGYEVLDITVASGSRAQGRRIGDITWPPGSLVVAASQRRDLKAPRADVKLRAGERVVLLVPARPSEGEPASTGAPAAEPP